MLQEFKKFALRGNVIDLAVAVILGLAFAAIITSLVNDIIMPLIGAVLGGISFADLAATVGSAVIAYGKFIQAIVNFIIVAFVLFLLVRGMNRMAEAGKKKEAAAPPPPPSEEVRLLAEIRDLLRQGQSR